MKIDTNITSAVDALGRIKAEIADLRTRERELVAALIESGETEIDGADYRATVSKSEAVSLDAARTRDLLDALVADGTITRQKRAALNKRTTRTTVRVTARKSA